MLSSMGRPREHNDAVRDKLLAAAEEMVDRDGPHVLSVRSLADTVDTTTRAVYTVFGSKAGLLEALATRLFELLSAAIDSVATTTDAGADLLSASLQGFRQVALDHASLYRLVFLQVVPDLPLGPTYVAAAEAAFARLEALVGRVLAGQSPTKPDLRRAARSVHALTEGLATMELRGGLGPPNEAEAVWRAALVALLVGFATTPSNVSAAGRKPTLR